MTNLAIVVVVGLLGGMAIGLQAPLASTISQRLGWLESVFLVHLGGLVAVALPLLFLGGGRLGQWATVPPAALLGGCLGVAVIGSTVYMVPRIGVAAAVTLIITGQLLTAATIDHFGALGVEGKPLTLDRVLGLGLVLLGAWWTLRR
jgi:bacterial/archaeal transporter family-2 protein